MTKFMTAALIATVALGGAAIARDNPGLEHQEKLKQLWGKTSAPAETGQVSVTREEDDQGTLRSNDFDNRFKGKGSAIERLRSVQPTPTGR